MNNFSVRVIEAGGKFEVAKRLVGLDRRYGGQNKISFAIVGGHGASNSIKFGEPRQMASKEYSAYWDEDDIFDEEKFRLDQEVDRILFSAHILKIEDLFSRGVARMGSFFTENPVIILASCSTGQREGIGIQMSKLYGAKLIAPDCPTSISRIEPKVQGNEIDFEVDYYERGSRQEFLYGENTSSSQEL